MEEELYRPDFALDLQRIVWEEAIYGWLDGAYTYYILFAATIINIPVNLSIIVLSRSNLGYVAMGQQVLFKFVVVGAGIYAVTRHEKVVKNALQSPSQLFEH